MYEFMFFSAITVCSTTATTSAQLLEAEKAAAKKIQCDFFQEEFTQDVICTAGGYAKYISLKCVVAPSAKK